MAEEIVTPEESVLKQTINEITQPFIDLISAPRALWGVNTILTQLKGYLFWNAWSTRNLLFRLRIQRGCSS